MKKKALLISMLLTLITIVGCSLSSEANLPKYVEDSIKFDYEVIESKKKSSIQDGSDQYFLIRLNSDDFNSQVVSFQDNFDNSFTEDNLDVFIARYSIFKEENIFNIISSGNYKDNYYLDNGTNFVVFFILEDDKIAIFCS